METLRLSSVQAPDADPLVEIVADGLRQHGYAAEAILPRQWQKRLAAFDSGEIEVCWMCGTQYVWRADPIPGRVQLLACPVPDDPEVAGRPLYFSDVIVRAQAGFNEWESLRGARLAYNEPQSYSGYWCLRRELAGQRLDHFFGTMIAAGSHARAIRWVLAGQADCAAIDCTVLAATLRAEPDLGQRLRVIRRLGPAPAPPWVAGPGLPAPTLSRLRQVLLTLTEDEAIRAAMQALGRLGFGAVDDQDYDPIRAALRQASS